MSNSLESLLTVLSVPSERIRSDGKKDIELFLKAFKKRKRNITTQLNKNQINKSQVIFYHQNVINYLENIKKKRIDWIIQLTREFLNDSVLTISSDEEESVKTPKKRLLDRNSGSVSKKQKLMSVDEELHENVVIDAEENSNEIPTADVEESDVYNEVVTDVREEEDIVMLETEQLPPMPDPMGSVEVKETAKEVVGELNETYKIPEQPKIPEPVAIQVVAPVPKAPYSKLPSNITSTVVPSTLHKSTTNVNSTIGQQRSVTKAPSTTGNHRSITKAPSTSGLQKSVTKAPSSSYQKLEQKTPLYKSKFHVEIAKNKSQSKIQLTSSVSKKTAMAAAAAAEVRRQEDEKRRQMQAEKMKSQRNLEELKMKMGTAHTAWKTNALAAPKVPVSMVVAAKPSVRPVLSKPDPNKTTSTERMPSSRVKSTLFQPRTNVSSVVPKMPSLEGVPKQLVVPEPQELVPPPQEASLVFKTPFTKKRLTIMSDSCKKIISNHQTFDLAHLQDQDSDMEDEDEQYYDRKNVPVWTSKEGGTLVRLLKYHSKHDSASKLFRQPHLIPLDLKAIFGNSIVVQKDYLQKWKDI